MIEYLMWLALGLILGYSLGLRQVRHYFGGLDPVDLISYTRSQEDNDAKK